jgi:hypothetical protein
MRIFGSCVRCHKHPTKNKQSYHEKENNDILQKENKCEAFICLSTWSSTLKEGKV